MPSDGEREPSAQVSLRDGKGLIRSNLHLLNGIHNGFLIVENLPDRYSHNPFDLRSSQPPTTLSLLCRARDQVARDVGAPA